MMTLHALLAVGLHLIPLLLLGGIEEGADLIGGGFVNLHHLFVALIARHGGIAVHGLHLRLLGFEDFLNFGLLVGSEVEFPGEHLGVLGGIHLAVPVPLLLLGVGR